MRVTFYRGVESTARSLCRMFVLYYVERGVPIAWLSLVCIKANTRKTCQYNVVGKSAGTLL